MRSALATLLCVLAMLLTSSGGLSVGAGASEFGITGPADRQAVVMRGSASSQPHWVSGKQSKRGLGPLPTLFVLPTALRIAWESTYQPTPATPTGRLLGIGAFRTYSARAPPV